jgi:hypothetical protein
MLYHYISCYLELISTKFLLATYVAKLLDYSLLQFRHFLLPS